MLSIRPVVSWKKRSFSTHSWPGCTVPPHRVLPFSKVKRPASQKTTKMSKILLAASARCTQPWSISSLKCFAFQTIRPVVSRKKRVFSAHFGPGGAVLPPRVSPFSKLKRSSFRKQTAYVRRSGFFSSPCLFRYIIPPRIRRDRLNTPYQFT